MFIELYLDWYNNYVTVSKFAHDNDISYKDALSVIQIGKDFHHADTTTQRVVSSSISKQS
jgi:hypothetical protein